METTNYRKTLAEHLLRAMALDHVAGRRSDLDSLSAHLDEDRAELRSTLSALHREGYLDVLRMRLTLEGFVLGCVLLGKELPELRPARDSLAA